MDQHAYDYTIEVGPATGIAGGRYAFVASIVGLCRHHADGAVERFASPFGQYHGESAGDAETRAREGMERWIEAQRGL